MTKEDLKKYQHLKAEIDQLKQEITDFYETCVRSPILDGMPKDDKVSDPTPKYAEKAAKFNDKLHYLQYKAILELEKIEDCIQNLEPRERRLMREYYIKGKTWEQVCVETGKSWRTVHRIHKNALRKI